MHEIGHDWRVGGSTLVACAQITSNRSTPRSPSPTTLTLKVGTPNYWHLRRIITDRGVKVITASLWSQ
jgi:hypothetical protein